MDSGWKGVFDKIAQAIILRFKSVTKSVKDTLMPQRNQIMFFCGAFSIDYAKIFNPTKSLDALKGH